jgi:hypothetical protein
MHLSEKLISDSNFFTWLSVPALETIKYIAMKRFGIIALLTAFMIQGFSQEASAENKETRKQAAVADTNENAKVVIGKDLLVVKETNEATSLKADDGSLTILESLEGNGSSFEFKHFRGPGFFCNDKDEETNSKKPGRKHFKGHWAGIEVGFNNYMTSGNSVSIPDYMSLHSGKSKNFNLNFAQISLGMTRRVGFVTGLGLNWNNYVFSGNNNIQKMADGMISVLDTSLILKKSKLTTLYLDLPFLFEFQIPADNHHLNIAFGPIGGLKLLSHSAMTFENDDKIKSDSDFSLNLLRYGFTARIGYENFNIFGTYYMTPLFQENKGPGGIDYYPFEIGIAFTID